MICCLMAQRGLYTALAYLDDVVIIEPTQTQCKATFDILLNLQVSFSQFHSQLDQSCLLYPMSDFSWSWNRHCSLSSTSKKIMCLSCYPFSGEQAQTVNVPSFIPNDSLASLDGQHMFFKGAAHFLGILLPWQTWLNTCIIMYIQT